MDPLSELILACRGAESDKVTERKRCHDELFNQLSKKSVLEALCRNSDKKANDSSLTKKPFGWDNLFKVAKNIMWIEVDILGKAKNADTPALVKRKHDVTSLLKHAIRLADKRGGQRLRADPVVAHVVSVMRDPTARSFFGVDLTSVLLKDVLSVRKYACQVTSRNWHELLCVYSELLQETTGTKFDRVVVARIIHTAVQSATRQCDVRGKNILPLLADYFSKIKKERSMGVLELMVGTLNTLCSAMAVDGRLQVCRLGERIAVPLLFLWNSRPSDQLKDELIAFFQLQLSAHQPRGARTEDAGAFAVDWDIWKSNLRKLYEALYNELQEFGGRHKFAIGIRELNKCQLKDSFVHLAADVFNQLYREGGSVVDVTQVSFLATESSSTQGLPGTASGPAAKKRRLESGWQALREVISENQHSYIVIPWLQLLGCLLYKYPSSLPEEEYIPVLGILTTLLQRSKKVEASRWAMRCLLCIARSQALGGDRITTFTVESCTPLWRKVWAACLRCVSLHHAQLAAFDVLSAIIHHKLLKPDRDVWNLFIPTFTKPTQASLGFLGTYFKDHDLPENYCPSYLAHIAMDNETQDTNGKDRFPLRNQLLDWLLPSQDSVSDASTEAQANLTGKTELAAFNVELFAKILVLLTQRDTRFAFNIRLDYGFTLNTGFQLIEDIYLETHFHKPPDLCTPAVDKSNCTKEGTVIRLLERNLLELLIRSCNYVLEISDAQLVSSLELICHTVCTCLAVLCELTMCRCYTADQIAQLPFIRTLKEVLSKFSLTLGEAIRKEGAPCVRACLGMLEKLLAYQRRVSSENPEMASVCRAVIQQNLFQQFATVLKERPKGSRNNSTMPAQSNGATGRPSVSASASNFNDFDMDFDDDFSRPSSSLNNNDKALDDFDDITQKTASQSSDGFSVYEKDNVSLLDVSQLGDKEQLKLQLSRILCRWLCGSWQQLAAGDTTAGSGTAGLGSDVSQKQVVDLLLDLLDEEMGWDVNTAVDIQLADVIISECSNVSNAIADETMEVFLDTLRCLCQSHRKDQEVCAMVLGLLSGLVPHLCPPLAVSMRDSVRESRVIAVQILSVFWKLTQEGQYGRQTRIALAQCMKTFVKYDSSRSWALWRTRGSGEASGEAEQQFVHDRFLDLVADPHHALRLTVAGAVKHVFSQEEKRELLSLPSSQQKAAFDLLYSALQKELEPQRSLIADETIDETSTRTSSMLHTLCNIARYSAICEKEAIFAICQMAKERNLAASQVNKVLDSIASHLKYENTELLMASHLAYIVHHWLKSGYEVIELPFQIIGFKSKVLFFKEHFRLILPFLVMRKNYDSIDQIARLLNAETKQLLELSVVDILVHILPLFAASKADGSLASDTDIQRQTQVAGAAYDALMKYVPQKMIEQYIVRYMPELVVKILMTLNCEEQGADNGISAPEPNPPYFSSSVIECTLAYISQCQAAKSLVSGIAKVHQDGIQKMLLSLSRALAQSHVMHEKCRVQRVYHVLVKLLLREFHEQLGGSWAFVLRETVHTLLRGVTSMCGEQKEGTVNHCTGLAQSFILMCLELLSSVCQTALSACPKELGLFLPTIVRALVPLTDSSGEISTQSAHLLHWLLVESADNLQAAITLLDPLPDTPLLAQPRKLQQRLLYGIRKLSFKQEVRHFLEAGGLGDRSVCDRRQGLGHLAEQLASPDNKYQLAALLDPAQDEESNVLIDLINELFELAKNTQNDDVRQGVAECLGELGPANLQTTAISGGVGNPTLTHALSKYDGKPEQEKYCLIFHLLDQCLISPDVELVGAASEVLKQLLATRTGMAFQTEFRTRVPDSSLFCFLHPFKNSKKKAMSLPEAKRDPGQLSSPEMWCPPHGVHQVWLSRLVQTLINSGCVQDEILRLLTPVTKVKSSICEEVLPLLVHDALVQGGEEERRVLSDHVARFFANHAEQVANAHARPGQNSTTVCTNKESVDSLLKVIQYLRVQQRPSSGRGRTSTVWENNFWLSLDYLHVARAALTSRAYFSSLLFAEIWCTAHTEAELDAVGAGSASRAAVIQQFSQNSPPLSVLEASSSGSDGKQGVQQLLLEAYRAIGDPDAIYAFQSGPGQAQTRIGLYVHENNWERALSCYDVQLQSGDTQPQLQPQLMQALYRAGSNHVLDVYLSGISGGNGGEQVLDSSTREIQYQAALRNTQWHLHTPTRLDDIGGFHESVYCALICLKDGDTRLSEGAMRVARCRALGELQQLSLESTRSCYPCLSQLHCTTLLQDTQRLLDKRLKFDDLLDKWRAQDSLLENDFEFLEPVLSLRCSVLAMLRESCDRKQDGGSVLGGSTHAQLTARLLEHTERLAVRAREAGRYQIAEGMLHRLKTLQETCSSLSSRGGGDDAISPRFSWRVEEARLFWARGEQATAQHLLKELCKTMRVVVGENAEARRWYPVCLSLLGDWLAHTLTQSPKLILEEYLAKAVDAHEDVNSKGEDRLDAYLALARYADAQYQSIVNHMKSGTYEEKQNLYKKAREEINQLIRLGEKNSRYLRTLQKQYQLDDEEEKAMLNDRRTYLQCAVKHYLRCLQCGSAHDLRVFRLTSLWFDNTSDTEVCSLIQAELGRVASHKFLSLMYQLAARMSSTTSAFQGALHALIERCSLEHPQHTLLIVLALAHANKDEEVEASRLSRKASGQLSKGASSQAQDEARVTAAKQLVDRLKRTARAPIIVDMERLCLAYIQLANFNVDQYRRETKAITLPSCLLITKIKDLINVAMPTVSVPVDPAGRYDSITHVKDFKPTFKLAGGINLPKIITCVGSDGIERRQLVKGKDDLRQDAVMQQVFGMVNKLLAKEQETRKRNLTVRQYKVIPLSQRSGLLEWCEGTIPLGEYLIGSDGAHCRYRPEDLKAGQCRKLMSDAKEGKGGYSKLEAFLKACENFQPVFRHFFFENFLEPATWYQKRLTYTHSVATNSIVGYILGLGDRHVQNMLVDTASAELVHIDLGVAFEQGMILPTPETVPFRLTRDLVDGMGIAGVEGVFRRCCEKTMEVMHTNQEALLTILEVLLYDPLYAWTLSPEKAAQLQRTRDLDHTADVTLEDVDEPDAKTSDSRENVNRVAGRALLRLHQKLQGLEEGTQLSVTGQVNKLIQEARDPHNLSRLFPGWQPYI